MLYRTGVIESFKPSRDNRIRTATVRYVKNGKQLLLTRPIKLYQIESNAKTGHEFIDVTFVDDAEVAKITSKN